MAAAIPPVAPTAPVAAGTPGVVLRVVDDGIADAEMLLRPASGIEPHRQSLPEDLHSGSGIAGGKAQVQELAVVLKLDRQRLVGERFQVARPVLELAIDRDGFEPGDALETRLVGCDEGRGRRDEYTGERGLKSHGRRSRK